MHSIGTGLLGCKGPIKRNRKEDKKKVLYSTINIEFSNLILIQLVGTGHVSALYFSSTPDDSRIYRGYRMIQVISIIFSGFLDFQLGSFPFI
jgi:hypothetical protein